MDYSSSFRDLAIGIGALSAGLSLAKFFITASAELARVPKALEGQLAASMRIADASERQADSLEIAARAIPAIEKLRSSYVEIENSIGVLAEQYDELSLSLKRHPPTERESHAH